LSAKIRSVEAVEMFADRGIMGLDVTVTTDTGAVGVATPSAGVSTGIYEADFILDGGDRYGGMGQRQAAKSINEIVAPALMGMEVNKQREVDTMMIELDGTPTKAKLGANAIVGVSLAVIKAAANDAGLPLYQYIGGPNACTIPIPIVNAGLGGRYRDPGTSRWLKPSFEYVAYGAGSFWRAHEICWEIKRELGKMVVARFGPAVLNYSGEVALAGYLKDDRELLEMMTEAIAKTGFEGQVAIYVDMAAGCYYEEDIDRYVGFMAEGERTRDEMLEHYTDLIANYPFISMEDPLHEEDMEGHAIFTKELGIEIVGDDLFTTNIERLRMGIELGAANSMVLKITQVGTVSEALDASLECVRNGYNVHPCGSRGDASSVVDFSVGLNAGQVRAGGAEAQAGYKRCLTIERELGDSAAWLGKAAYNGSNQRWLR
jgi:enolase